MHQTQIPKKDAAKNISVGKTRRRLQSYIPGYDPVQMQNGGALNPIANYNSGQIPMQRELGTPQMMVAVPNSYQNTVAQPQVGNYVQNNQ